MGWKEHLHDQSRRESGVKGLARGYLRHGYPWSQYPEDGGAEGQKLKISTSGGIIPFQAYNMKIASMSFLLQNSDDPIIWRDAYKYEFINQLLGASNGRISISS